MSLTEEEVSLTHNLGFELDVVKDFKTKVSGKLIPFDPTFEKPIGIAVQVPDGNVAESLIGSVQTDLVPRGYRAFWTDLRETSGLKIGWAVALLRSTDHLAIVEAIKPYAESHSGPEVIHSKLKSYENFCDLEIVGASHDWVAVKFKSLPENLGSFAEDIYLFCPDSCDLSSGIGSKGKYTKEVRAAAKAICPTISEGFLKQVKANYADGPAAAHLPAQFTEMLLQDAERNVRLVAWELKQNMYFFFWWD